MVGFGAITGEFKSAKLTSLNDNRIGWQSWRSLRNQIDVRLRYA